MSTIKFTDRLLRLIVPLKCMGCGEVTLENVPFCRNCLSEFAELVKAKCPVCGRDKENCICAGYGKTKFLFYYDTKISKRIIASMKYHATAFKADYFAGLLMLQLPCDVNFDAVVFPPRSKKNIRRYGFDQSEMIASALAKKLCIPCLKALHRTGHHKEQKLLSAEQRRKNVSGAFTSDAKSLSDVKKVILFDDVMTTGATINECTKILKKSGVRKITVLTLARTPKSKRVAFSRKKYYT